LAGTRKGPLVRLQKRLLTGVRESAMEGSSTGHSSHSLQQLPVFIDKQSARTADERPQFQERSLAKRELANSCPRDVDELMEDIIGSINGIRTSPVKLRGCIVQSELSLFLR
jgi:hypothetical protein